MTDSKNSEEDDQALVKQQADGKTVPDESAGLPQTSDALPGSPQ